METADEAAFNCFKAVLFLLALLRCIAKQGHAFDSASLALLGAFKFLAAPVALGKSIPAAIDDYSQTKAGVEMTMSFTASLQFMEDMPARFHDPLCKPTGNYNLI